MNMALDVAKCIVCGSPEGAEHIPELHSETWNRMSEEYRKMSNEYVSGHPSVFWDNLDELPDRYSVDELIEILLQEGVDDAVELFGSGRPAGAHLDLLHTLKVAEMLERRRGVQNTDPDDSSANG